MRKAEKPPTDPELKRRILELVDYKGGGANEESVADIIETALKLLKDRQEESCTSFCLCYSLIRPV